MRQDGPPVWIERSLQARMQQVKLRLFFAIKRRWAAASPENIPRTFKRMADAQRLLKDLVSHRGGR